jgi:serine/threonine protein kinase
MAFMGINDDLGTGQTLRGFTAGQKLFNRYTLQHILGRGGMGVVWLAQDEQLEEQVALKFLSETVTNDPEAIADLKHETKRSRELNHHYIVRIHDFAQDELAAGISMEYVDGKTATELKLKQPARCFNTSDLLGLVAQVCEALEYAHSVAMVVHRDLKPSNLMVNSKGQLKVTDFGIARSIADTASRLSGTPGTSGTLAYMSPQQANGEKPSAADDIYALGATLYELLASKPPFYSGDILDQLKHKEPVRIAERRKELEIDGEEVPAHWEETIAACLAKEPALRPQSAAEVARRLLMGVSFEKGPSLAHLGKTAEGSPRVRRWSKKKISIASVAVVVSGAIIGYAIWQSQNMPEPKAATESAKSSAKSVPISNPDSRVLEGKLSASWATRAVRIESLFEEIPPRSSHEKGVGGNFNWWNHRGTTEWVQCDFETLRDVTGVDVYWFASRMCQLPQSWRVLYKANNQWKEVEGGTGYGIALDCYNRVRFKPIRTTSLRIEARLQPTLSAGIIRWKILPAD